MLEMTFDDSVWVEIEAGDGKEERVGTSESYSSDEDFHFDWWVSCCSHDWVESSTKYNPGNCTPCTSNDG